MGYEDGGKVRPILHRASLVEMAVPYADPAAPFQRKCAFDVGDYGLGNCANSLELGCDCLGNIQYFDALLNNSKGEARRGSRRLRGRARRAATGMKVSGPAARPPPCAPTPASPPPHRRACGAEEGCVHA